MLRVLLIGGTLRRNFGGPSIVNSLTELIEDAFPDAEVRVLAFWRNSRIEAEGYTEVPFSPSVFLMGCLANRMDPLRRILALYAWPDAIVDYWGLSFTDAKKRSLMMRLMEGFPLLLGKLFGKPVIKYTADMGPFVSRANRWSARFYLNRIDMVLARSEDTREQLLDLGIRTPIEVCPDTGHLLQPEQISREEIVSASSSYLIGLSVSHVAERKMGTEVYAATMAAICDHLVQQMDATVLIIPNETSPERPRYDDVRVAYEVYNAVINSTTVAVLDDDYPAARLKGIIAACDMVVAARYHTVVAALSSGVPVLSLSWHDKYRALMGLFGQETHVADLKALDIACLRQRVDALWSKRSAAREEICRHIPEVIEGVMRGMHLTKQIVEGAASSRRSV